MQKYFFIKATEKFPQPSNNARKPLKIGSTKKWNVVSESIIKVHSHSLFFLFFHHPSKCDRGERLPHTFVWITYTQNIIFLTAEPKLKIRVCEALNERRRAGSLLLYFSRSLTWRWKWSEKFMFLWFCVFEPCAEFFFLKWDVP